MNHCKLTLILLAAVGLSACDTEDKSIDKDVAGDAIITETILDDVEGSEGTISDAMINVEGLDETTDAPKESDDSEDGANSDDDSDKKDSA